jgi:hypothetical protein
MIHALGSPLIGLALAPSAERMKRMLPAVGGACQIQSRLYSRRSAGLLLPPFTAVLFASAALHQHAAPDQRALVAYFQPPEAATAAS